MRDLVILLVHLITIILRLVGLAVCAPLSQNLFFAKLRNGEVPISKDSVWSVSHAKHFAHEFVIYTLGI
jgi:hypothetical protein